MDKILLDIINRNFTKEESIIVFNELSSIGLHHVMAESEYNLLNTRLSILKLAKKDINEVISLTKSAKIDFRDVIYWANKED